MNNIAKMICSGLLSHKKTTVEVVTDTVTSLTDSVGKAANSISESIGSAASNVSGLITGKKAVAGFTEIKGKPVTDRADKKTEAPIVKIETKETKPRDTWDQAAYEKKAEIVIKKGKEVIRGAANTAYNAASGVASVAKNVASATYDAASSAASNVAGKVSELIWGKKKEEEKEDEQKEL
jgi:hypothetical protein